MPIIILILFFVAIAGGAFMVMKTLKKLEETDAPTMVDTKDSTTAQEFLPFIDIKDDLIDLGGFKYRAILECSSINYYLRTREEQNIIEYSFRNFLNGLQHPICFYIQTKELNYSNVLESLEKDVVNTKTECPSLSEYAEIYYSEIANLKKFTNTTKQKKKYIIVPYEDAITMSELNSYEKEKYSKEEMVTRLNIIQENLSSMGIKAKRLKTSDLIELMYSIYHRDEEGSIENIVNGDYLENVVSSDNYFEKQDVFKKAIVLLNEASNKIDKDLINNKNPEKANEILQAISKNLFELKQGLNDIERNGGIESVYNDLEWFDKIEEDELKKQKEIDEYNSIIIKASKSAEKIREEEERYE